MMHVHEVFTTYIAKFKRFPFKILALILAGAFVFAVVGSMLVYRFLIPDLTREIERPKPVSVALGKEKATLQQNEIKQILNRNIFNKVGEVPKEDEMREEKGAYKGDVPVKSELPLRLTGLIYGGSPTSGLAVIENLQTKKQNSFLVGVKVTKDAVLAEVLEDKVIFQMENHKEFLELEKKPLIRGQRTRKKGSLSTGKFGLDGGSKYSEEGFERDGNKISMSADYRSKLLTTDFAKVLQDAKAEPVYEGGELNGFRLTRIRPDSVYEKGGLLNDDVVKEINGVSLVDTAQAIKLLNSLRGTSEIEIGLNRGGKRINVNIQVK